MSGNTSYRGGPSGFNLSGILRDLAVSWKLLLDPAVPGLLKLLLPVAALVYWISPLDIIPGMPLDDIAILLLAARLFVSLAPRDSVHRAYSGGSSRAAQDQSHSHNGGQTTSSHADDDSDVIDTTWRIVND
jgi:uncharacterized membrane protein YkvA (DUF1232 family)